jgi:hypothetical protein
VTLPGAMFAPRRAMWADAFTAKLEFAYSFCIRCGLFDAMVRFDEKCRKFDTPLSALNTQLLLCLKVSFFKHGIELLSNLKIGYIKMKFRKLCACGLATATNLAV